MEYDEYLTKFDGILLSLSNRGLLHELPDLTEEIENEIEELSKYVSSLPNSTRCKIAYYMILNTELRISEEFKNDESIRWFLNVTPAIPFQGLVKWIQALDLFDEYCAAIENSPVALGEELIGGIVEDQSFCDIHHCLTLWSSIFKKFCKFKCGKLAVYFEMISRKIEECLRGNPFLSENFVEIVVELLYFYKNPKTDDEMYKLSNNLASESEEDIDFAGLFGNMAAILNSLNFDNLSDGVRISVGRLLTKVKMMKISDNLLSILSKLAIKESDIEIETLISDEREDWFYKFNDEELNQLLHNAFKHLVRSENIRKVFLNVVGRVDDQYKWLDMVFKEYKPDLLKTSSTEKDLIETFNKLLDYRDTNCKSLVPLCMQSPVETIKKLCQLVMSLKATDLRVFHELQPACKMLLPSGLMLLDHVIITILSEVAPAEENSFLHLVVQLGKNNLLHGDLLDSLIRKLKEFLDDGEMNKALLCLSIMEGVLLKVEPLKRIPLLVFFSQVLGHFSWDLNSFSSVKASGREIICSYVKQLMKQLDNNINSETVNAAREEILKCWVMNQAVFCDLWFDYDKIWPGNGKFDSFIMALVHSSSQHIFEISDALLTSSPPDEIRTSIVLSLTKILPVLTLNMWSVALEQLTLLWSKMESECEVFDMFLSAWHLLTLLLSKDNVACYNHCTSGFIRLFASASLQRQSFNRACDRMLSIIKSIDDGEIRKSSLVALLPFMKNRQEYDQGSKVPLNKIEQMLHEELKH